MTKIWRETGFVENDPWVIETEELKAGEGQKPLLSLEELIAKADESNDVGFGVLIKPADDVRKLEPYLYRLELVAVAFPAFNDGRAFSHASLLRERLGYTNELRAVGDVLIDQVPLMLRCRHRQLRGHQRDCDKASHREASAGDSALLSAGCP
jgi:uncharacterized protein (DUF934 family)